MLKVESPASQSWAAYFWTQFHGTASHQQLVEWLTNVQSKWPTYEPLLVNLLCAIFGVWVSFKISLPLKKWFDERANPIRLECPLAAWPGYSGPILEELSIEAKDKPGMIQCYDPATGYHLGDVLADTAETINVKIECAEAAQKKWKKSSWAKRRQLMNSIQKWIISDCETIARVAARDTGKTAVDAAFGELLTTCAKTAWISKNGEKVLTPETRPNNLLLAHKTCKVFHEPYGVVCACVSWNYPAHNVLGPILSSLFAGNAIVIKSSELVAWSSSWFILGIRACLASCNIDQNLVQLVTCFPEHAEALTQHPKIAHITFIGSETVGRKVAQAATNELTPVTLELGGKDPAIILKDANLKYFNSTFMRACFQAVGQNCIGIERFVVSDAIVDKFIAIIEPRIKALRCGSFLDDTPFARGFVGEPPQSDIGREVSKKGSNTVKEGTDQQVDCGAMISDARFGHLEALIEDAVKQGAKLLVGGKRWQHPKWTKGHYFQPTLITNVTPDMMIAQEELFAPIFLVLPFKGEDWKQAVAIANSTRYGLGSSVFGGNRGICEKVADGLDAGMVNINDFAVSYLNQGLPFGGVKKSGYGRFAGPEGLLGVTTPKVITRDTFFSIIRTGIPRPLDYPFNNAITSWNFVCGLLKFAYGESDESFKGLGQLIWNAW
ncbi:ALDH-like protein [Tilletiaria anomala UBC 951]|uniref:ALDH-like protein n=1 Tax=Tilletiaria anomala (strain ATCC 24038 / CBS 436.72 / UBC 951) TaxID=1037660 RepID=A0A066VQT5_TILAU|nr:ALDH-like protein [Tilletiaria anomala UBC 951]KDN41159.1 ALDH-like protein [Tilletiaria anomala UBC 951]